MSKAGISRACEALGAQSGVACVPLGCSLEVPPLLAPAHDNVRFAARSPRWHNQSTFAPCLSLTHFATCRSRHLCKHESGLPTAPVRPRRRASPRYGEACAVGLGRLHPARACAQPVSRGAAHRSPRAAARTRCAAPVLPRLQCSAPSRTGALRRVDHLRTRAYLRRAHCAAELRAAVRQAMDSGRDAQGKDQIKFYLSEGKQRLKELTDMLGLVVVPPPAPPGPAADAGAAAAAGAAPAAARATKSGGGCGTPGHKH